MSGQNKDKSSKGGEEGQDQEKFTAPKLGTDPVKVKCEGVEWPKQDPTKPPVDYGPLPEKLTYTWRGQTYTIPVGGAQKDTMPREAADFLLQRAKRYWTLKAKLVIMEPSFK